MMLPTLDLAPGDLEPEFEWWPELPEDWEESDLEVAYYSTDWQEGALCAQTDPEAFFPEKGRHGSSTRLAVRICAACPVRERCLEWAVHNGNPAGIWAGLTEHERRPLMHDLPCAREGCNRLRGFRADGQLRKYCGDGCYAAERVARRRA